LGINAATAGIGGKVAKLRHLGKLAGLAEGAAKYGDEALTIAKHLAPPLENQVLQRLGRELVQDLPEQTHHILTITHDSKWTPIFEKFVKKYNLDLKGAWNQIDIPHKSKHAEQYHEWVYNELVRIDKIAKGDKDMFLELFDTEIKQKVIDNPWVVRKDWWEAVIE